MGTAAAGIVQGFDKIRRHLFRGTNIVLVSRRDINRHIFELVGMVGEAPVFGVAFGIGDKRVDTAAMNRLRAVVN